MLEEVIYEGKHHYIYECANKETGIRVIAKQSKPSEKSNKLIMKEISMMKLLSKEKYFLEVGDRIKNTYGSLMLVEQEMFNSMEEQIRS